MLQKRSKIYYKEGELKRIRADLEAGRLGKLLDFLNALKKYINTCQERTKTFESEFTEPEGTADNAMSKHGGKKTRLKETARSAEAWGYYAKVAGGAVVIAGVCWCWSGSCSCVASFSIASLVFSGSLFGGMATTGAARGLSIVHKFTKEDYDLIQSVTKHMNVELGGLNEEIFLF